MAELVMLGCDGIVMISSVIYLLKHFWNCFVAHDPNTIKQKGRIVGKQYRSAIFYPNFKLKRNLAT